MATVCRLCLQCYGEFEDGSKGNLNNMITKLLSIDICFEDASSSVCSNCCRIIHEFDVFYEQVHKSQHYFGKTVIFNENNDLAAKPDYLKNYSTRDESNDYLNNEVEIDNFKDDSIQSYADNEETIIIKHNKKPASTILKRKLNRISTKDQIIPDTLKTDLDYNFPSEIFRDGELIIKGPSLDNLMKQFFNINCDLCKDKQTFTKISELFKHYKDVHDTKGYLICCNTRMYQRRMLCLHMARHLQPTAFECPVCKKSVSRPNTLKLHLQTHLPDSEKPYKCDKCDKTFSCIAGLTNHNLAHVPVEDRPIYACKICRKELHSLSSYRAHISTIHSNTKFLCSECGRSFRTKNNLTFHMTTHDPSGKNKIKCPQCNFVCKNKQSLRKHIKLHSTKQFKCSQCDYVTYLRQKLNAHVRIKHSDDKPFVCSFCDKRFKLKSVLKAHLVQHTGERKFLCPFCPKTFAASGNYYTHRKRMHSDKLDQDTGKELESQLS